MHTSLRLHHVPDDATASAVVADIRQDVSKERDLAVGPGLFVALARQNDAVSHVQVMPRRGRARNELANFRFDAVLHVGPIAPVRAPERVFDWRRDGLTLAGLHHLLETERPEMLGIDNIPNARVADEVAAMAWLRDAPATATMGALRAMLRDTVRDGVEPDDLLELQRLGYRAEISWIGHDAAGAMSLTLTREDQPGSFAGFSRLQVGSPRPADHCNHPRLTKTHRLLIPKLRAFLREEVPRYMVPSAFTMLDAFPTTPNGKTDRKALLQLPVTDARDPESSAPPTSACGLR